jgi:hypothetical protein
MLLFSALVQSQAMLFLVFMVFSLCIDILFENRSDTLD